MRMITRGGRTDPLILAQIKHIHAHSHPHPSLTLSHIYFSVNTVLGVMGVPTLLSLLAASAQGTEYTLTNLKGLYLENTLLTLSHTLATVLVTL